MSSLTNLSAISPIDGRYRNATEKLATYFSEAALIKYRVLVEVEYFIALCELPLPQLKGFDKTLYSQLRNIYKNFNEADAEQIKTIEKTTNHDVLNILLKQNWKPSLFFRKQSLFILD